ncbi:hypothetical protein CU086_00725 [Candidatus Nasuia deltocephalinicola]|uniref:Glutamyl/glutaminyl-tRNA synthetase class Ib catalytic domain-containing protein n=1 Tax=Candidatus Nasuia deltocephalincola TaxID=1160784 RepID=A0A974WLS7_9PROT|nr:hypothetical protein CU086_00725 [Candidatus Nasuia deltocephalinicola]
MNTRFSPEASWNLHIGHLKIIFRNLELSKINNGKINLRIDDTNPKKNKKKYKKRIVKEIKKINRINENLFNKNIFYTSNYFYKLFQYLEEINKKNLKKIKKISEGWYKEKKKIINIFKNKISYRIIYKKHYRVGWNWFLYGTYDYTHCISDKIENIYYSICSEEFKKNIHIYNLIINILYKNFKPKQKEVRKLKIKNNILSKSKLKKLIKKKFIKNSNDKKLLIIKNIKIKEFKILKILLKNINKKYKKYIFNKNINLKIENLNEKKIIIKKNFIINKKIIIKNLFFIKKIKK